MIDRSQLHLPNHPNASSNGLIRKYRLKAAEALGKPLPPFSIIHHHGDDQLVICEDTKYHYLLESREEALKTTGDVHKRKCTFCKQWDDPINLINKVGYYHKNCQIKQIVQNTRARRERMKQEIGRGDE